MQGWAEAIVSDDINSALARLAEEPVPGALARTETTVLARIGAFGPRLRDLPPRFWLVAAMLALLIGVLGGLIPNRPEKAPLFPLSPESGLAPSSLLAE